MDSKRMLRSRLVAARERRDHAQQLAAGADIADCAVRAWRDLTCVTAYAGVGTEPPTRALLDGLTAAGVRVLLPLVDENELRWATYTAWEALRPGRFGIPEPVAPDGSELADAQLLIVPGLAVDRAGHRLGRGGGYYDRALADVDPSRVVAVVYDDELLDDVPVEAHDQPVGWALTPTALHRLG